MANTNTSSVSRRSVAKGAAWSIPALSLAATAPALAASPSTTCADIDVSASCPSLIGSRSIVFSVCALNGGVIPAGTVVRFCGNAAALGGKWTFSSPTVGSIPSVSTSGCRDIVLPGGVNCHQITASLQGSFVGAMVPSLRVTSVPGSGSCKGDCATVKMNQVIGLPLDCIVLS